MTPRSSLPWPGMILAAIGASGLLLGGAGWWLAAAILVLWLGSLWLVRPEAEAVAAPVDTAGLREEAQQASIEPIGLPLVILSGERITSANKRSARMTFAPVIVLIG